VRARAEASRDYLLSQAGIDTDEFLLKQH